MAIGERWWLVSSFPRLLALPRETKVPVIIGKSGESVRWIRYSCDDILDSGFCISRDGGKVGAMICLAVLYEKE